MQQFLCLSSAAIKIRSSMLSKWAKTEGNKSLASSPMQGLSRPQWLCRSIPLPFRIWQQLQETCGIESGVDAVVIGEAKEVTSW